MGIIREIDTYEYIVKYEGRVVDSVDNSIAGNYEIFVRIEDEIGRVTIQKIMDLVIENKFANPLNAINNNNMRNTLIIAIIVSIISLFGISYMHLSRKKIIK